MLPVALAHLTVTAWLDEDVDTLVGAATLLLVVIAKVGVPSANTPRASNVMAISLEKMRKRSSIF